MTPEEACAIVDSWTVPTNVTTSRRYLAEIVRTLRRALAEAQAERQTYHDNQWRQLTECMAERAALRRKLDAATKAEQRLEDIPREYSWTLCRFWNHPWAVNLKFSLISPHGELIEPIEPIWGKTIDEVVTAAISALEAKAA